MIRVSKRSSVRPTTGPRIGAFVSPLGVTVRVIEQGERPSLPRATVAADSTDPRDIVAAATVVQSRVIAAAKRPVAITVSV